MARRFTVIVDWTDGEVADADEVVVFANSAEEAISRAKQKWRMTIAAQWPHCRLDKVWILSPSRRLGVV